MCSQEFNVAEPAVPQIDRRGDGDPPTWAGVMSHLLLKERGGKVTGYDARYPWRSNAASSNRLSQGIHQESFGDSTGKLEI